jgi:hypothetical protein
MYYNPSDILSTKLNIQEPRLRQKPLYGRLVAYNHHMLSLKTCSSTLWLWSIVGWSFVHLTRILSNLLKRLSLEGNLLVICSFRISSGAIPFRWRHLTAFKVAGMGVCDRTRNLFIFLISSFLSRKLLSSAIIINSLLKY